MNDLQSEKLLARRRYQRDWARAIRAKAGKSLRLKLDAQMWARIVEAKPAKLSYDQWCKLLLRKGMDALKGGDPKPFAPKKLPGRNEPCWCGSGRKFKHCCARVSQRS